MKARQLVALAVLLLVRMSAAAPRTTLVEGSTLMGVSEVQLLFPSSLKQGAENDLQIVVTSLPELHAVLIPSPSTMKELAQNDLRIVAPSQPEVGADSGKELRVMIHAFSPGGKIRVEPDHLILRNGAYRFKIFPLGYGDQQLTFALETADGYTGRVSVRVKVAFSAVGAVLSVADLHPVLFYFGLIGELIVGGFLWRGIKRLRHQLLQSDATDAIRRYLRRRHRAISEPLGLTVIGVLLARRDRESALGQTILLCAVAFLLLTGVFLPTAVARQTCVVVSIILMVLALLLICGDRATHVRIENGWYGSNEYEAREIIHFILSRSEDDNFSGGSGMRPGSAELRAEVEREYGFATEPV